MEREVVLTKVREAMIRFNEAAIEADRAGIQLQISLQDIQIDDKFHKLVEVKTIKTDWVPI